MYSDLHSLKEENQFGTEPREGRKIELSSQ